MRKEKQIDEIKKDYSEIHLQNHLEYWNWIRNDGARPLPYFEYIATKLYNAGYRKQEWISVDERLPDKEGTYLTYTDKDRMLFDSFCIYPSIGTKFWIGGNGKVTHWMPLPEAPKMKGGE